MRTSTLMTSEIPTYVERTDLPRILVRAKGGTVRYYAYVNGYIRGPQCRVKGVTVVPLYYLSLVDMSGDGGKLQGIWSALISEPPQDVYLESVGTVALAHHDPQFQSLGYTIHWNYDQGSTNGRANDLHAVVESNMLTMFDPIAGSAPVHRERKQKKKLHHERRQKRKARSHQRVALSTATKKELGDLEERTNREKRPLFMLMVPGNVPPARLPGEPEETYTFRRDEAVGAFLSELYFAFLDLRAPWAMSIAWADFLWRRALAAQENSKLTTWFKAVPQRQDEDEEGTDEGEASRTSMPVFAETWLCRPNIALLDADLKRERREGRISDLSEAEEPAPVDEVTVISAG